MSKESENKREWFAVVEGTSSGLNMNLKEVWRYKDLILLFVRRTFVAQYKQTILGPAWAIIQPFLTTVVYTLFFGNVAGLGAQGVPTFAFYLSGTIAWTLFANCLNQSANAFIGNSSILGKVYFPRLVMPIAMSLSQVISYAIQMIFLIGFVVYYVITKAGVEPNWYLLLIPLLTVQLCILGLGFGTIISALTTKYRDLTMLVTFGVELWKFASPVAYDMFSMKALMGKYYCLYMLNPTTPIINVFRNAFLGCGNIDWLYYMISWVTTIVVFIIGAFLFGRVEKTFMDTI